MAFNDYDEDGTELLETYGAPFLCIKSGMHSFAD